MADYKRIVSYIYQYNYQVKGNNIGFTRLETRNGQCKIIVHVRVPNLQNTTVKVYTYCWYDGTIHGIALGDMNIVGGVGEFKILTQADDLCHTQYRLSDMGGILVYISDTMFLGTEWDDRPIQFEVMTVDTEKPMDYNQRKNLKGEALVEAAKETAIAAEITAGVLAVPEEQAEDEIVDEKEQEVVEQTVVETVDDTVEETVKEDGPLSIKRMEQLDQRAQELFGNVLSSSSRTIQEEEDMSIQEENLNASLKVDPKTAIEYFTVFKSCESKEEYQEVQQEIENLHERIAQLERICLEWKIKEERKK